MHEGVELYMLLIIERYREETKRGHDPQLMRAWWDWAIY